MDHGPCQLLRTGLVQSSEPLVRTVSGGWEAVYEPKEFLQDSVFPHHDRPLPPLPMGSHPLHPHHLRPNPLHNPPAPPRNIHLLPPTSTDRGRTRRRTPRRNTRHNPQAPKTLTTASPSRTFPSGRQCPISRRPTSDPVVEQTALSPRA